MTHYALLCGSAPDGYRQKKIIDMYKFLTSKEGGSLSSDKILIFPNGVQELLLEATLNGVIDEVSNDEVDGEDITGDLPDKKGNTQFVAEVFLYFCTESESDLNSLSADEAVGFGRLPVLKLGTEEIRKEVVECYEKKFSEIGVNLRLVYEADDKMVSEEELGFERDLYTHQAVLQNLEARA